MFESLQDRLSGIFDKLTRRGALSDSDVSEAMREVRRALLEESVSALLEGDLELGKAVLKDYINATLGFERLGAKTRIPAKSLMRMFGPKGNPQAQNLLDVVAALQKEEGVRLSVASKSARKN